MKKWRTYFPKHDENRMENEGNVTAAREAFLINNKNKILHRLVQERYVWMNQYIGESDKRIVELGCGAGLSKLFLETDKLILTDVEKHEWVDEIVDALNIQYPDYSVDVFICSHMIHHLANPALFFEALSRKLSVGGRILIRDIYTGGLMKIALRVMRHEGYSDEVDVFDRTAVCNNPEDAWSANCSIPKLLFFKGDRFTEEFRDFEILYKSLDECFLFFLSGGVIAKTFYVPCGTGGVKLLEKLDRFLIRVCPGFFAAGCSIVLKKIL